MKKTVYALQLHDYFIEFKWNDEWEWGDVLLSKINSSTINNIVFDYHYQAMNRLDELIADLNMVGSVDDIEESYIPDIKLVTLELDIDYKIIEE